MKSKILYAAASSMITAAKPSKELEQRKLRSRKTSTPSALIQLVF